MNFIFVFYFLFFKFNSKLDIPIEATTRILKIKLSLTSYKPYCKNKILASPSGKVGHLAENLFVWRQSFDIHQRLTVISLP
jgi:hypothetical protein